MGVAFQESPQSSTVLLFRRGLLEISVRRRLNREPEFTISIVGGPRYQLDERDSRTLASYLSGEMARDRGLL
jgi:hypothetical protein